MGAEPHTAATALYRLREIRHHPDGRPHQAGGVVEFGGLEAGPSAAPFALLRHHLAENMPDLTWREETEWMGHRPAPVDSIPVISDVPGYEGAFMGFGHHHVGLTGGPKTGRLLSSMITGQRPNIDLETYSIKRFMDA